MSQKTIDGYATTYCDEEGCVATNRMTKMGQNFKDFSNKQRDMKWDARKKYPSETWVTNGFRHRCPACVKRLGRLK